MDENGGVHLAKREIAIAIGALAAWQSLCERILVKKKKVGLPVEVPLVLRRRYLNPFSAPLSVTFDNFYR
jgi:hypothetical protein